MTCGRAVLLHGLDLGRRGNAALPEIVETSELAKVLIALGCPAEKSAEMAAQLDKRARQLAGQKGRTYEDALQHLLNLMQQGWSASGRSS
jgi:hypothetical protein